MVIDQHIKTLINTIHEQGHQALIVGGAVRDFLLNEVFQDIDIATNMPLEDLQKLYPNSQMIQKDNQNITLVINLNDQKVEVSRFRKEIYEDGILKVEFVDDYIDDCERRDFTINSFAYDIKEGLIDPYNAEADLKAKRLVMINNPIIRINEDHSRLYRALYFAAKYNFTLDTRLRDSINSFTFKFNETCNPDYLIKFFAQPYFNEVYNAVEPLFIDLTDGYMSEIIESDQTLITDKHSLLYYLIFKQHLSLSSKLMSLLHFKKRELQYIENHYQSIIKLSSLITFEWMANIIVQNGIHTIETLLHTLSKYKLIHHQNIEIFNDIKDHYYLSIDELAISIADISMDISIKEKYSILKQVQYFVMTSELVNEEYALMAFINSLSDT